jgi:hypothetical protein
VYQYNLMEETYGVEYKDFEMFNPIDCDEGILKG